MKITFPTIFVLLVPPIITAMSLVIVNMVQIMVDNQCHGSRENFCGFGPTMLTFPIALLQVPAIFTLKLLGLDNLYINGNQLTTAIWIFIGSVILGLIAGVIALIVSNMNNDKKRRK